MSSERLSLGFNSLIPENYKTQAEAFAKCLHHKLLSLRGIDKSSESSSFAPGSRQRQVNEGETEEDEKKGFRGCAPSCSARKVPISDRGKKNGDKSTSSSSSSSSSSFQGRKGNAASVETGSKNDKTEDTDEDEFYSHSESENGDVFDRKKLTESKNVRGATKKKLTSMSSEDSTIESWSSCQDFADFEKFADPEPEESNRTAKPCPKPQVSNDDPNERVESREKSGKKNADGKEPEEADPEVTRRQYDLESHLEGIALNEDDEETSTSGRKPRESSSAPGKPFGDVATNERQPITRKKETEKKLETSKSESTILSVSGDSRRLERNESQDVPTITHRVFLTEGTQEDVLECHVSTGGREEFPRGTDNDKCPSNLSGEEFAGCSNDSGIAREDSSSEGSTSAAVDNAEEESDGADDDRTTVKTKLQRSSSLKTWKTPPGTPGSKKIVRFADALGLDLADVRTFLDEVPKIPSSAYSDLHFESSFEGSNESRQIVQGTNLVPAFQQPGLKMDFYEKVRRQNICLEMISVTDPSISAVTGYARVRNLAFDKSVFVRYTLNNWETFSDLQASYVPNSCDGFTDKFSFVLYGHTLKAGDKLEFALRLDTGGTQYWDNNGGINYVYNCLPDSSANRFFSSVYDAHLDPCFDFY